MKNTYKLLLVASGFFLLCLSGCKTVEPENNLPDLQAPVISVSADGDAAIVHWNPVTNAISYKIERKKTTEKDFVVTGTATYGPYKVTGLEYGPTYEIRVKATCGEKESPYSNIVSVDIARYLPKPLIRVNTGITFLDVEWDAIDGATSYSVEHKVSVASEWTVDYTGNVNSYKVVGLESGVSYDVRVSALADGYSASYSDVSTVKTTQAPSTMISTGAQLAEWLAAISVETSDVAALANDIDMEGVSITSASGFAGTLEGQGFAIKNLVSAVPLFAQNSGTIKDIVMDESCVFNAADRVFGAFVRESIGGLYKNVVNKASVTYASTSDVENEVILGGIVGVAASTRFENCENHGAISFNAPGCAHKVAALGGLAGLVNNYESNTTFYACTNNGAISLNAKYGDPVGQFSYVPGNNNSVGINVAGIAGVTSYGDGCKAIFDQCVNNGAITLSHSDMSVLPADTNNSGYVSLAGISGLGQADFANCRNTGLIKALALVGGVDQSETVMKKKNYLLSVGGIGTVAWDNQYFDSCINSGNIEVEYYGLYDADDRWRASIGGIGARGARNYDGSHAHGCTMSGSITVTGKGTLAVGGIYGFYGEQLDNTVTSDCHITVNGRKGDVGGLVGYVEGKPQYYTIKGCSCAATIFADSDWGDAGKTFYYTIGGLMGRWSGANTDNYPEFTSNSSGVPCSFNGSISSVWQGGRVGMVVGRSGGDGKTKVFGEETNPIKVSGTITRYELDTTTITAENVEEYAIGLIDGTNTIYVTCAN